MELAIGSSQYQLMAGLITLGVVLALALYLCWLMVQPFVNVVLWAAVLAVVFYPMHRRIQARVGSPSGAAALSTLLVIVLICFPRPSSRWQSSASLPEPPTTCRPGCRGYRPPRRSLGRLDPRTDERLRRDRSGRGARSSLRSGCRRGAVPSRPARCCVVGGAVGAIVQMVLVVFTMFYMFRDGDRIRHAVYRILPLERIQMHDITVRTKEVIDATIYGVLVISAIQGTLGAIIFSLLGLPSPLLWGVVMFFLSMIPMAGSFLVWVPAAIYLALTGEYVKAGMLVAWGAIVIGSIDNFLSPRLVGRRARLHELLIFFSVLGGLQVFGVLGLVLGPVVVAVTLALIEMVRQAHRPSSETLPERL